jgi:hypothetical protein
MIWLFGWGGEMRTVGTAHHVSDTVCNRFGLLLNHREHACNNERQEHKNHTNPEAPLFCCCTVIPVNLREASLLKMPYSVLSDDSGLDRTNQQYSNGSQHKRANYEVTHSSALPFLAADMTVSLYGTASDVPC